MLHTVVFHEPGDASASGTESALAAFLGREQDTWKTSVILWLVGGLEHFVFFHMEVS